MDELIAEKIEALTFNTDRFSTEAFVMQQFKDEIEIAEIIGALTFDTDKFTTKHSSRNNSKMR